MQCLINNYAGYTKIHLTNGSPSIAKHLIFSKNNLNDEGLAGTIRSTYFFATNEKE
jgi:hypothetical protein